MSKKTFEITVLGNCATQTIAHETTSFLISFNNEKILIDCGPGIVKQLLNAQVDISTISAIVITHCHADHTAGYPYLLFSINLARSMKQGVNFNKIDVIALESVHRGLSEILNIQYPIENLEEKLVSKRIFTSTEEFSINDSLIKPFSVFHSVPTIGIAIERCGKKISFTSDTLFKEDLAFFVKDSDLLVHEAFCTDKLSNVAKVAGHSTSKEAGITAKNANVKRLVLSHPLIMEWNNPNNLINEAAENFAGDISVPKELDIIEV